MKRATHRTGLIALATLAMAAPFGANAEGERTGSEAAQATATAQQLGEVRVALTEMRSHKGKVLACLTTQAEKFPKCRRDAKAMRVEVSADKTSLVFKDVPPGRYAIAVLHDENGNGKADRALTMIPKEGFGFSRDAKVRMGPPKFSDAAFDVTGGKREMTIRMRYML